MTKETNNFTFLWESADLNVYDNKTDDDKKLVDGVNIIARVKGASFFPNSTSGNGVYYSKECWESVLKNKKFQKRLKDRKILGTIGHGNSLDDWDLGNGKASHIVTDMYIENGVGIAEYLIMNTTAGRELNTYLRSGVKLNVSTKCTGYFQPGTKNVIPESFDFDRIDFVRDPGYERAAPVLVEHASKETPKENSIQLNDNNNQEGIITTMENEKTVQSIVEQVMQTLAQKNDVKTREAALHTLTESLSKQAEDFKSTNVAQKQQLDEAQKSIKSLTEQLNEYKDFGSLDEIEESLAKFKEGEDKAVLALNESNEKIKVFEEQLKELEAYKALGTKEDISEMMEKSNILFDKYNKQRIKAMSTKYNINESVVTSMSEKLSFDEIDSFLKETRPEVSESKSSKTPLSTKNINNVTPSDNKAITIEESKSSPAKSLAGKLCGI